MSGAPFDSERDLAPRTAERPQWRHFDPAWYLLATPELTAELADTSPAALRRHYLEAGAAAGLSPNMFFDEAWYRLRYPEIAAAIAAGRLLSGYAHYCERGYLTHSPHWLYDEDSYAASAADLTEASLAAAGCANLYDHYLRAGAAEGRIAHVLFDPASLDPTSLDPTRLDPTRLGATAANPFEHFLHRAWATGEDQPVSPCFDPAWFRARYPHSAAEIAAGQYACALHAYLCQPAAGPGLDPLPQFSEAFYRQSQPEAASAIAAGAVRTGYEYFLKFGVFALHAPAPGIDLAAFLAAHPAHAEAIAKGRLRDAFLGLLQAPPEPPPPAPPPPGPPPSPADAPPPAPAGTGHLEQFGHHAGIGGWLFTGWVSPALPPLPAAPLAATWRSAEGEVATTATVAAYPRADIATLGVGIVGFVAQAGPSRAAPASLTLTLPDGTSWTLAPLPDSTPSHDRALAALVRPVLEELPETQARARLLALLRPHGFTGASTLSQLRRKLFLELDETILCPPDGVVLHGWTLSAPGALRSIHLHSGQRRTELPLAHAIRTPRPDVQASVGAEHGLAAELNSGFIAHLPAAWEPDGESWLTVETADGEIGHRGVTPSRLAGLAAIRFLAERVDPRYDAVPPVFDAVLGPSIAALNAERLTARPLVETIAFGPQPAAPALSVIVPLYGRLDFIEYQFARFSCRAPGIAAEYLYVLDDPALRRDAETLAASLWQRFRIPFRLLLLDRNMGYAPANNIGLGHARGEMVCFLNSDVFPQTTDWMERLAGRLDDDPGLGAIGALLLFEDGSVQHQGMRFETVPLLGNWHFPQHIRKGWRPPAQGGVQRVDAITGACLMLRRALAVELGGFDEGYPIGDFEDADLCLKLRARGLAVAVDLDTRLHHLERQSQAGGGQLWRRNITLFNAWRHERRWAATLAEFDARDAPCPGC